MKNLILFLFFLTSTFAIKVIAEEDSSIDIQVSCEQQAINMNIPEGEEFDSYVRACIENNSNIEADSEELTLEFSSEESDF